jgi:hypothetical protein
MQTKKNLLLGFGMTLMAGLFITGSVNVFAQVINQSDLQGTNIWNNPIPLVDFGSGLDPAIISQANQIIEQLNDAYADYAAAEEAASEKTRRYTRNRDSRDCVNPHAARVNQLAAQARTLLSQVDNSQAEILKNNPAFRTW